MKLAPAIVSGITLLAFSYSGAAVQMPDTGATMSFSLVTSASGGVFSSLPTTTYFDTGTTQTGVTHMLVGPIGVTPTGENAYTGNYEMVNASTGATVSSGMVKFKMPDSAAYIGGKQVVGVIPLSGGWGNTGITLATGTGALDGVTASVAYNPAISVMQVTIGSAVSYVPYVATNESTLVFESPFWISTGETTVKFNGGSATKQADGSFSGMINQADGSSAYAVTLDDPNDNDADGVAEIVDADNYWYSGCVYYNGAEYSSWLGWFNFYYPPANSGEWNNYAISAHSCIWHYEHGLLYTFSVRQNDETWLYVYDMKLGWLATSQSHYPYIYAFDVALDGIDYGEAWLCHKEGSGSSTDRYFYAQTGKMHNSSNMGKNEDGYQGWWSVPGANAQ